MNKSEFIIFAKNAGYTQEELAIQLALYFHRGQRDKGNGLYLAHLMSVASSDWITTRAQFVAAILHDIIEDTECTGKDLLEAGIEGEAISLVAMLTKTPNLSSGEYLENVSTLEGSIRIKLADLEDNMDITRLRGDLSKKDVARIRQYHSSYVYLERKLNEFHQ